MKKFSRIISAVLALSIAVSLCACGSSNSGKKKAGIIADDPEKHVDLVWYIRTSEPSGFKEVMEKANEYVEEKLNASLDIQCIEPGDYDSKVQLALASDEAVDIIWTSNWANKYEPNVAKGAFLALDDYLELPELSTLKARYKEGIWEAATVANKIYGVPVEQVLYNQGGATFIKDVSEKYNLTDKINSASSMDDIEEIYDVVREGESSDFAITTQANPGYFVDHGERSSTAGGFDIINDKVTYSYDEAMDNAKRMRTWNEKGFFPADIATLDDTSSLVKQKKVYSNYSRHLPGDAGKFKLSNGYDVIAIPTSRAILNRSGVQSTLNAISASCKNPVRALKLIDLLFEDQYLLNLLCYGIEGRDYEKDPNDPNRMNRDAGSAYYIAEFMVGSQFLAYLAPSYEDDVWEQTKKENEAADVDPYIGFSFDPSPVESEMSQISSVGQEYNKIIGYGLQDPEVTVPERQEKLEMAGQKVVIDEIQRQLDEWLASEGK